MEPLGLGLDIVELERVRGIYARHGERFLGRVYAAPEQTRAREMRDPTSFGDVVAACAETDGPINVAVFLGGQPTQAEVDADPALIAETITDNAVAAMTLLHGLVQLLRARGAGTIIGIGSVVGDRGRRKNYVYGAGKAAFHTYLSGLRSAFVGTGLHVMTVKPGYIQRPGQPAPGPKWLVTEPEPVARKILQAAKSQRNVVYVPGYWRGIMYAVRSLPEALFKRTKF